MVPSHCQAGTLSRVAVATVAAEIWVLDARNPWAEPTKLIGLQLPALTVPDRGAAVLCPAAIIYRLGMELQRSCGQCLALC
jgi:hypothetical protein